MRGGARGVAAWVAPTGGGGEVEARDLGGKRRILCLTLGALAELETAFGAERPADLGQRFAARRLKAADLMRILRRGPARRRQPVARRGPWRR